MTPYNTLHLVFFSPTHTTARVARAVADGIGLPHRVETDLTLDLSEAPMPVADALTIIAAPVYGGRVAPVALQRLARLRGSSGPAILLVVYGNRDYEDALVELRDSALGWGFVPLSAGAFVGEHSYSRPDLPIAAGRPDERDLELARRLGRDSYRKLEERCGDLMGTEAARRLADVAPGVMPAGRWQAVRGKLSLLLGSFFIKGTSPYKVLQSSKPTAPVSTDRCNLCGRCIGVCPTHAIAFDADRTHITTDVTRCIRCCACVKACPAGARVFDTPFAALLHEKCSARREPEVFL